MGENKQTLSDENPDKGEDITTMDQKSEVGDDKKIRSGKMSEIGDKPTVSPAEISDNAEQKQINEDGKSVKGSTKTTQKSTSKKRIGTSGPISYAAKKIKQEEHVEVPVVLEIITMDKLESPSEENFEKNGKKYLTKCVLKMGCNKCTEVFFSDDGYKHHLYKTHRIKKINKYPPIIINRVSQTLKDILNTSYKRPVEQKEESAKYLYENLERGTFDPISDDKESKDDSKKEKPSTSRNSNVAKLYLHKEKEIFTQEES